MARGLWKKPCQWLSGVPRRGDEKEMTVNRLMIEIGDDSGKVTYRDSFITRTMSDSSSGPGRSPNGADAPEKTDIA
jgi:hypothetical protein